MIEVREVQREEVVTIKVPFGTRTIESRRTIQDGRLIDDERRLQHIQGVSENGRDAEKSSSDAGGVGSDSLWFDYLSTLLDTDPKGDS